VSSSNPARQTTLSCVDGTTHVSKPKFTVTVADQSPVDGSVDVPDQPFASAVPAITVLPSGTTETDAVAPAGSMSEETSCPVDPSMVSFVREKLAVAASHTLCTVSHTPLTFCLPVGQPHVLVVVSSTKPCAVSHATLSCVDGKVHVSDPDVTVIVTDHSPVDGSVDVPDQPFASAVPAVTVDSVGTAETDAVAPAGSVSEETSCPVEPSCKLSSSEKLADAASHTLCAASHAPLMLEVPLGQKH
jgi:hypothetical protein